MIRTQISLDERAYRDAKTEARKQGISLAEFLRRAVARALQGRYVRTQAWMSYAGTLQSGDSLASQTVDEVIYGGKDQP
jgi:hypothetical protein